MRLRKMAAALMAVSFVVTAAGCANQEKASKYVEVKNYKGIEVEKVTTQEVQNEDIETYFESVRGENRVEVTDRELREGDVAEFDYKGTLDGEVFDEGNLTLGNGESYVPGFEEGIYGHKLNETFELPITFPEGYGGEEKPELSGADVVFTITIKSIKVLPEMTDELVQKVSKESKTVDEYREEVRKIIQKSNEETAESTLQDAVWKAVFEGDNVNVKSYPEERVKKVSEQAKEQMKKMITAYGQTWEAFVKESGMTEKELDENIEQSSKEYVKQALAAEYIAEMEGIKFSKKDYKEMMKKYADEYQYESVDAIIEEVGEDSLKEIILQDKVKELLVKECKQVETKAE